MKVSKKSVELDFKPFEIRITAESAEEARALFAIFNHVRNTQLLGGADEIRDAIGQQYRVARSYDKIAMGVSYEKFYATTKVVV